MNSHHYETLDVADGSAWELEEYESNYRPPGLHHEASAAGPYSQHHIGDDSNYDHISTNEPSFDVEQEHPVSRGHPLRRYYLRTIVGALGPVFVLSYLIIIWRTYLVPADSKSNSPMAFGPSGAKWVFYSWFAAGVIGLSLSLYGLAGAEAGMLMERSWQTKNAMHLMLHADNTWSGPGGWFKAAKWVVQARNNLSRFPGRLWLILTLPSVVVFVAWPLSGLCLEMETGYMRGTTRGASLTGFVQSNFNLNPGGRRPTRGPYIDAQVPGYGAVYTPARSQQPSYPFMQKLPAVLPNSIGVEDIFLTAQNKNPIEGNAWGLLLHYDCSVVNDTSDLRLLKDRRPAQEIWKGATSTNIDIDPEEIPNSEEDPCVDQDFEGDSIDENGFPIGDHTKVCSGNETSGTRYDYSKTVKYRRYRLHDNATLVEARKEPREGSLTDDKNGRYTVNLDAVIETAYESWPHPGAGEPGSPCHNEIRADSSRIPTFCYYGEMKDKTDDYPGFEHKRTFEVLLWQGLSLSFANGFDPKVDVKIDQNISSLYGQYIDTNKSPLSAIGVTCSSSSSVGTADIDGVHSTYSNFVRTNTPRSVTCAERFGAETLACTLDLSSDGWFGWLFDSIGAPSPIDAVDISGNPRLAVLQASQLCKVLLQAYATYAIKLMYNNGGDFLGADDSNLTSFASTVTAFRPGTVIVSGVMPAIVPIGLFALWAIISTYLCLAYGFRRRWSEILDGHTVFRLGVELSEGDKLKLQQHSTVEDIESCSALHDVPGFVSDLEPNGDVGRIGLVAGKPAVKWKLYR